MTFIDIKNLSDEALVAQYVIELMGHGHFLSKEDYLRLDRWRSYCSSADELLLVLDEILPEKVAKSRSKGKKVFSLSAISKAVEKRLSERKLMLDGG